MINAARSAGSILLNHFHKRENLQITHKTASDFVSQADLEAESCIQRILLAAWPRFGIRLEEGGLITGSDQRWQWIVDPLDGTTNFIRGIPHFAVSIGLAFEGVPVAGVVFSPLQDELFSAAIRHGAFLNNRQIRCADTTALPAMLLGTGFPFQGKRDHEQVAKELLPVMKECAGVRRIGAASLDLCYVACGRFDAYWEHQLHPWDVAAGVVIVREAGGIVTRLSGAADPLPHTDILATSAAANSSTMQLLNQSIKALE